MVLKNTIANNNHNRIIQVMGALKEGIAPFVMREYKQIHKGARYLQEVELTVNSNPIHHIDFVRSSGTFSSMM